MLVAHFTADARASQADAASLSFLSLAFSLLFLSFFFWGREQLKLHNRKKQYTVFFLKKKAAT